MRRYLNKSLFYQGDSNILPLLLVCYTGIFFILNLLINDWFICIPSQVLYTTNYKYLKLIVDTDIIIILYLYIFMVYSISVGMFKRKKWATLLSGPFTKKDVRRRELLIVIISTIIFFIMYFLIVWKGYIRNYELISYLNNFKNLIAIDLIKMISLSLFIIGVLFLLDSIFSNLYFLIFSVVFLGIYGLSFLYNTNMIISGLKVDYRQHIFNFVNEFLFNNNYYDLNIRRILLVLGIISVMGIVFLIISSVLTNKIKVENMTESIMFEFPKIIGRFMAYTFIGLILSPIIINFINYYIFYYELTWGMEITFRILLIVVLSIISYLFIQKLKRKRKSGLII
ncbi:hypothetical protein [Clostridium septicum]|uniref:ABC transporter permease n=1 Tax=Clostridium septicum TaxID=1504 RepID=A0A9N7JNI8_CLOSE|nr:hypothetical protein [Clostridium septicum]AYE35733.1 hypothetical protein CP523_15540 [Clostridium septicum]QAS61072.1 hypothetical protein EI377_10250 [Clostridium septicum]UEC19593.1 hypothetical protein LK444_09160 [Clostridium septicum]USS02348.1 hypothetical protein NH397_08020 [Clostridium septicum]